MSDTLLLEKVSSVLDDVLVVRKAVLQAFHGEEDLDLASARSRLDVALDDLRLVRNILKMRTWTLRGSN